MAYYGYSIPKRELKNIQRICVLGWGLLGDLFMRVPTIEALRRRFPEADILVVTDPGSEKALKHHPAVDEILPFTRRKEPTRNYIASLLRNVAYLRRKRFDLCVNLYSGGASPAISRAIGARIRVGYDHTSNLRRYNNLLVEKSDCGHWIDDLAKIVAPLGIELDSVPSDTRYYVSDAARSVAHAYLNAFPGKKVIYNLGAGGPEKIWSIERVLELAKLVHRRYGAVPVILTCPGHEEATEWFIREYATYSHEFIRVPRVDFEIEAAIVEGVDLMATADSGLKHLAAGVRTPIAAWYLATRPEHTAPRTVPFVACMIEARGTRDKCGYKPLSPDLSVDFVYDRICKFLESELAWAPASCPGK